MNYCLGSLPTLQILLFSTLSTNSLYMVIDPVISCMYTTHKHFTNLHRYFGPPSLMKGYGDLDAPHTLCTPSRGEAAWQWYTVHTVYSFTWGGSTALVQHVACSTGPARKGTDGNTRLLGLSWGLTDMPVYFWMSF